LVTFLATPFANYITGQIYYLDGGQSICGSVFDTEMFKPKL